LVQRLYQEEEARDQREFSILQNSEARIPIGLYLLPYLHDLHRSADGYDASVSHLVGLRLHLVAKNERWI